MSSNSGFHFDVALSFADEDRHFVEQVAAILKNNLVQVFYDEDEDVSLWGRDLGDALDEIYRLRSKFVVLFISKYYANKMWTNHERKSAFARAIQEEKEYVLPARFDDTELTGLRPTVKYIDLRKETPETFASKIIKKISAFSLYKQSQSDLPSDALPTAAKESQDVLGYTILGVDDEDFITFFDLFGDPPPQDKANDSEFEEIYFNDFGEMNEILKAIKRITEKANESAEKGADRQKAFERAWFEEGISRASRYALSKHNQKALDPELRVPGLKYVILGVRKGYARMIKVLRPHEISKESSSIIRDAHEVYFKDINIVPQIPIVLQQAVQDSKGNNQEFLRLLFVAAMRLRTFGPDSELK